MEARSAAAAAGNLVAVHGGSGGGGGSMGGGMWSHSGGGIGGGEDEAEGAQVRGVRFAEEEEDVEEEEEEEDEEEEDEVMELGGMEEEEEEGRRGGGGEGGRRRGQMDLAEEGETAETNSAPLDLHTNMEHLSQDESSSDQGRSPPPEPIITLAEDDDEEEVEEEEEDGGCVGGGVGGGGGGGERAGGGGGRMRIRNRTRRNRNRNVVNARGVDEEEEDDGGVDDEEDEEEEGGGGNRGGVVGGADMEDDEMERRVPSASPSSLSSASSCSSSSLHVESGGIPRRHHVHRHHRHRTTHKHHRHHQKHHRLSPHQEQLLAMAMEGGAGSLNGGGTHAMDAAKAAQINGAVAGMVTLQNLQNLQNLATLQGLPQVATLAAGLQGIAASLGPSSAAAAAAATQLVNAVASAAQSPLNLSVGSSGSVPTSCAPVSHDSNTLQKLQQQQMSANNAVAAAAISQQVLASQQSSGSSSPAATSMPQFILASGQLVQGIQGAQLLIPTSQGLATQTILTIPVNQVTSGQVVNLALNNGQVVSTTLGNLQALAQPSSHLISSQANGAAPVPNSGLGLQHLLSNGTTPGVANQQHNTQQATTPQHQLNSSVAPSNVPPSLHHPPMPCVSMQRTPSSHSSLPPGSSASTAQHHRTPTPSSLGNSSSMVNPTSLSSLSPTHHMQQHSVHQQQQQQSTTARNSSPQQQQQAQQPHHTHVPQHHHYPSNVSDKTMNGSLNGSVSLSAISQRLSAANSSISITPTHVPHSAQSQHHHGVQLSQQQQQSTQHHHHQNHQQQARHMHQSHDHHQSQHNHLMHKLHSALNGSGSHHKGSVDQLGDMPNQPTINQTTSNVVDGINLDEIKEFAKAFKLRRLSLGLTQTQVGQALSVTEGPAYSQSAICSALATQMYCAAQIASQHQAMFEKLDITPKSAQKIKPVLERWMKEAEERYKSGQHNLTEFIGVEPSKKRKRRTSFTPQALEVLNAHFERNTHPSGAEITALAQQLGYEREVIRIWFCNKRQALKNTVRMMSKSVVT